MAAQGFLLIASFLLVLFVIARPLGFGLARLINNTPLPGLVGAEHLLWRGLGISQQEMNWRQYLCQRKAEVSPSVRNRDVMLWFRECV